MASSEAPPSSSSETPTINNSTKTRSKFSIRSWVAIFCVSRPKPLENIIHSDASSSSTTNKNDHHSHREAIPPSFDTIPADLDLMDMALEEYKDHMKVQINLAREKFKETQNLGSSERDFDKLRMAIAKLKLQVPTRVNILSTTNKDDHHSGAALAPSSKSKLMHNDLLLVDSAFAKTKEYMDHMRVKINQAHEKFKELQILPGNDRVSDLLRKQRDHDELRRAIKKLKVQIPSHSKLRCTNSNPRPNHWPNINGAEDEMTHFFYLKPEIAHHRDFEVRVLQAFDDLSLVLRSCLLCFFKFPPLATIKRRTMIYLWIGFSHWRRRMSEDEANLIFDELVKRGLIEPIYQNCPLEPDSCRMSLSVRSSLYKYAADRGFTSNPNPDMYIASALNYDFFGPSCLINVGEAIVNWERDIFENIKYIRCIYIGRWQSSATHHIELADAKILHGLKSKSLKFLSLQGISMITKLPKSILELKRLEILDLRACHHLETIPDNIGLLSNLTHLDMSECYFLEHMPKSLAHLFKLEVLKGFFIGDFNNEKSCTLHDLSRLSKLRKLNIYVSVKDFHRLWEFDALEDFEGLQKLTISWGGCSLKDERGRQRQEEASTELLRRGPLILPRGLQKLDLQCFPIEGLINWLKPAEIKGLKKLYIRGGQLCDLGQSRKNQGEHWNVEILRLKYLSELAIDWSELRMLFPKLVYFHQVECPKFTNFPCDEGGVWMDKNSIYVQEQPQKYSTICGIGSSSISTVECGTLDEDDYNIGPR